MKKYKVKGVNEYYYHHQLDNGLNVYLIINRNSRAVYFSFLTKFGSNMIDFKRKNEKKFQHIRPGTAHFLEHQLFSRPDDSSAFEHFIKIGADNVNAGTSYLSTEYVASTTKNYYKCLSYLIDYVQDPYFSDAGTKKEKGIIIEELKMGKDSTNESIYNEIMNQLYHHDNNKNPIIGYEEDINNTTTEELQLAYDYFYHPSNMVLFVAGNINVKKTLDLIISNQSAKKYTKKEEIVVQKNNEPDSVVSKNGEIKLNVESPRFNIAYKIPLTNFKSLNINDADILFYLEAIVYSNIGPSTEFHQYLFDQKLIMKNIDYLIELGSQHVIILINAETKYVKKVSDLITNKINNMLLNEVDFNRFKKAKTSKYINMFDYPGAVIDSFVTDIIILNEIDADYYDLLNDSNYDIALNVLNKITLDNYLTLTVKPIKHNK